MTTTIATLTPLTKAFADFEHAIEQLPKLPPIVMAELDEDDSIAEITVHCPSCGSQAVQEIDWSTRWNDMGNPGFGESPTTEDDLYLAVYQGDGDYATLLFACAKCDQALDMSDITAEWC